MFLKCLNINIDLSVEKIRTHKKYRVTTNNENYENESNNKTDRNAKRTYKENSHDSESELTNENCDFSRYNTDTNKYKGEVNGEKDNNAREEKSETYAYVTKKGIWADSKTLKILNVVGRKIANIENIANEDITVM